MSYKKYMKSKKNKGKPRHSEQGLSLAIIMRQIAKNWVLIFVVLVVALTIAVSALGGKMGMPTWNDLYQLAGLSKVPPTEIIEDESETQIHFIDVGQGDASLIVQGESYALIDAGTESSQEDLVVYLQALGIEKLDYLIQTHPHADHIGGMDVVLENFEVELVVLPDESKTTSEIDSMAYENVFVAIDAYDSSAEVATEGNVYPLGLGEITVLSTGVDGTDNLNNISLCLMYTKGDFNALFTGDGEKELEEILLEAGEDIKADVFQVGHHGSSTSNIEEFLYEVSPEIAVASCGYENRYGHPHSEIIERFDDLGVDFYRTDLNGSVVVTYSQKDDIEVFVTRDEAA